MVLALNRISRTTLTHSKPIIRQDLYRLGIRADRSALKRLSGYPHSQYKDLRDKLTMAKDEWGIQFDRLKIDSARKVKGINFAAEIDRVFLEKSLSGMTLDLTDLKSRLSDTEKDRAVGKLGRGPVAAQGALASAKTSDLNVASAPVRRPVILKAGRTDILTSDGLLNPEALNPKHPYPRTFEEYREMMEYIAGRDGVFPGDEKVTSFVKYFVDPSLIRQGVKLYEFVRGGFDFTAVIFNPRLHGRQLMNRLIFSADFISQAATYGAIGTVGCSYDRKSYYEDRFFNADHVGFVYSQGMPVSFAAVDLNSMEYKGHELDYAFIHFVMTLGKFQGMGLTTYLVREILASLYYHSIFNSIKSFSRKNLFLDEKGNVVKDLFKMWVLCHTGRVAAGHQFLSSFGIEDKKIEKSEPVVRAMINDADRRNYGSREGRRPLLPVTPFGWRDEAVYPEKNRYPLDEDGRVKIPQKERRLPNFDTVMKILGGEEGLKKGNSAYYAGLLDPGRIKASKKKDKKKFGGGGAIGRMGDNFRGNIMTSRFGKKGGEK